jgi:integrase/recombinase XerD
VAISSLRGKAKASRAGVPVRPAVQEFLQKRIKAGKAAGTITEYRRHLYAFADYCEARHLGLEHVTWREVDDFIDLVKATHHGRQGRPALGSCAIHHYALAVKTFLKWCSTDRHVYGEVVSIDTVKYITLPRLEQAKIAGFTQEQVRALLAACDQEPTKALQLRNEMIVWLLWATGIRVGELCGLTVGQVTLSEEASIEVFGKGRKWRRIPLGTITKRKLARYLAEARAGAGPTDPLFVSHSSFSRGQPLGISGVEEVFESLGKRANISGVRCSPHSMRHGFAQHFIRSGGDVYSLSRLLGHRDVKITEHYLESLGVANWNLRELVIDHLF